MAVPTDFQLAPGDLVFACNGHIESDPISGVTEGYRGARVNHVGVVIENKKGRFVLEAIPPEVRVSSWELYQRRTAWPMGSGQHRYLVGRLQEEYRDLIPAAIAYGLTVRDTPYDQLYLTDDSALYCSELVVDMFASANGGKQFFRERPMSFRDPATGKIHPAWQSYYDYYGIPVPQGAPGSNPGDISRDGRLDILAVVGDIPGYSELAAPLDAKAFIDELVQSEIPKEFDRVGPGQTESAIEATLDGRGVEVVSSPAGSSFPVDVALGLVFGFVGAVASVITIVQAIPPKDPQPLSTKLMIDLVRSKLTDKQNRQVSDKALAVIIGRVREVDDHAPARSR